MEDTTRLCPECGGAMPPIKYGGRGGAKRFCSERCRVRVYRREHPGYVAQNRVRTNLRNRAKAEEREATLPSKPRCRNCNAEMARRKTSVYCNAPACQSVAKAEGRKLNPPCSIDECGRPVIARGYCGSHYRSEYYDPKFGKSRNLTPKPRRCPCGEVVYSVQARVKYCSDACRYRWRGVEMSDSTAIIPWEPPFRVSVVRYPRVTIIPPSQSRRFACACVICGERFLADGMHRTCSSECWSTNRRATLRRNLRKYQQKRGRFSIDPAVRLQIYERDGWVCQLCDEPTSKVYSSFDPKAPTLDHIIPRSLQLIQDHSPPNLRLAHALCNSLRSNDLNWSPEAVASRS